jgi:hypothetical protein
MCALTSSSPRPSSQELLKLDHDSRHYLHLTKSWTWPAWSIPSWRTLKAVNIVPKRTSTRHYASSFLMCDRSFARNLFCCKSIACAAFVDVESTFLELSEGQLRAPERTC